VPSNITVQGAKKDTKDGKKRLRQHPQWVAAMAGYNNNDDKKADVSDKEYIVATRCGIKHQE
jgi:hypothetical protein